MPGQNIEVRIQNGYQAGLKKTPPLIRILSTSGEEFRIDKTEIEEIIKNTIIKGKYTITKPPRCKYRRINITN